MRLGAQSGKTPAQSVKQLIFFHWMPQNDWHRLALVLTSMWKSCGKRGLLAGLAPRLEPLINRFAQKQQWQFVLACGLTCNRQHGNQAASASKGAFEACGLSPPSCGSAVRRHKRSAGMSCRPRRLSSSAGRARRQNPTPPAHTA